MITLQINHPGTPTKAVRLANVRAVANFVASLDGERDLTAEITSDTTSERLLLAVDGSQSFLGLDGPNGVRQFAVPRTTLTVGPMVIGGQPTYVEPRFVLDLSTAATVVTDWLQGRDGEPLGVWERR